MMTPLLKLEKVCSAYGQSKVLWDVDMEISKGSAVALIGRNGVGKTTLLNTIVGVQKLSAGRIMFGGEDVSAMAAHGRARAGIGFVPQGRHVFAQLSVMENLTVGLAALSGRKGLAQSGIAEHIFDLFPKLTEIRARKAGLLSGGEQQQLAIGRALAGQPRLLLLDEPTEGIQPSVVKQIEHALRRIRAELGVTIVIVEQYLDFAWSFAERYHVMQRGKIVREGNTQEETAAQIAHLVNI
jgi:urea transport system ATP-binding protein